MRLTRWARLAFVVGASMALLGAGETAALEKCAAGISGRDGTIQVQANDVQGALKWGNEAGQENTVFFNDATCVVDTKARKCVFGAEGTLERITPPPGCTVYLDDGVGPLCSAYIKRCIPGVRTAVASAGSYTPTWTTTGGFTTAPSFLAADFSRVGDVVTVTAKFGGAGPVYAIGTNTATLTVPPGLPVANPSGGYRVSGVFSSDWYRNSAEDKVGIVAYNSSSTVLLKINNAFAAGPAQSWCSFVYTTSAP